MTALRLAVGPLMQQVGGPNGPAIFDDFNRSDSSSLGADWDESSGAAAEILTDKWFNGSTSDALSYWQSLSLSSSTGYWVEVDYLSPLADGGGRSTTAILLSTTSNHAGAVYGGGFNGSSTSGSRGWQIVHYGVGTLYNGNELTSPSVPIRVRFEIEQVGGNVELRIYTGAVGGPTPSTLVASASYAGTIPATVYVGLYGKKYTSGAPAVSLDNFAADVL